MENHMSAKEASEKWETGTRRIYTLCEEGRIPGATRFANVWAIPVDTEKSADARTKVGNM